jgi:hypothetical protein
VSSELTPGLDLWPDIRQQLDPLFVELMDRAFEQLLSEGYVLRPFSGTRRPLEQAILWCQSRTPLEAELIARRLHDERAVYLAAVIRRAMKICSPGRWATNNLPGQSWHNFGLALDVHVVSEDGRAVWGPKHAAYARLADVARSLGLFPGFDLVRQDVVHVQLAPETVRTARGPWALVDRELETTFPQDAG